jgi:hypothetical protein
MAGGYYTGSPGIGESGGGEERIMENKEARELAEQHWDWLESLLFQQRLMEKKLFIDSFVHGWKHGIESKGDTPCNSEQSCHHAD